MMIAAIRQEHLNFVLLLLSFGEWSQAVNAGRGIELGHVNVIFLLAFFHHAHVLSCCCTHGTLRHDGILLWHHGG